MPRQAEPLRQCRPIRGGRLDVGTPGAKLVERQQWRAQDEEARRLQVLGSVAACARHVDLH